MAEREQSAMFGRGSWSEVSRIGALLRRETVGGALLVVATVAALVWANVDFPSYESLRDTRIGPAALHLDLTLGQWAADGLLAIFFFVAGLELKREFVAGDLREPRKAAIPIAAAVGGMAVPAVVYVLINLGGAAGRHPWVGHPDGHRHRFRAGCSGADLDPSAERAADLSAHPGGGRRPARDHHHRPVLHPRAASGLSAGRAGAARPVRRCGAAADPVLVPAAAVGSAHLGAGARLGHSRHGRRGAARVHRAGDPQRRGRRTGTRDRGSRSISSTASGRCPPAWRCRSSRSSPPA